MEASKENLEDQVVEESQKLEEQEGTGVAPVDEPQTKVAVGKKAAKKGKRPTKKSKRKVDESSASDASDSDNDSESEDSSDDEKAKRKRKQKVAAKRAAAKKKLKAKAKSKKSKSKKYDSTSEDSTSDDSSDSETDSEVEDRKSRRKALRAKAKKRKSKKNDSSSDESDSDSSSSLSSSASDSEDEKLTRRRARAKAKRKAKKSKKVNSSSSSDSSSAEEDAPTPPADVPASPPVPGDDISTQVANVKSILRGLQSQQALAGATKLEKLVKRNVLEFKRVDQVYDMKIRDWKLVESNTGQKDEFDCVFTVRRRLDWEGKYKETQVDIKSKVLRNALQEVFKECKSISLVEDTPQIDPHSLFHYYGEIKRYIKKTLKPKLKKAKKSKLRKKIAQEVAQCKLLLSYLDEDYDATRKALKPMLKASTITYDLVWALFKPNTIVFTPTYANKDDPRCFKVDSSYEYESWMTGIKSCVVEGRYLEYDGKAFGHGDHQVLIQAFKGHKKITSLATYPLKYHKDPEVSEACHFTLCRLSGAS